MTQDKAKAAGGGAVTDLIGKVYGKWRVAAIIHASPWPWAWLVLIGSPRVQARISVHSLHTLEGR